ncbi:hypothetical protein GCM10023206_17300 [Acinetobacter puyangensis]|uniref:Uncharacterized protein n=1 Tax=Acinetobacter puyangensis TaxID=1096779 RepID=A0A240E5I6_9GAMM|nr:hypothetical protein SAMN05421731_102165 [Acinetobacter puyangensis]
MNKRLNQYDVNDRRIREKTKVQVLAILLEDNEASRRVILHNTKRIIQQHKAEIQELAYK